MSIIMAAGKKRTNWVADEVKVVKLASDGKNTQEVEEKDELLEAALGVVASGEEDTEVTDVVDGADDSVDDAVKVDVKDEAEKPAVDVAKAVAEVVEKAEAAEAVVQKVEQAVGKIEDAAQELKSVCGDEAKTDVAKTDKIDEVPDEIELEIEVEDEPKDESKDDSLIVESKPEMENCGRAATAASSEEFYKFSMLSDVNKKKLRSYWGGALGYPKDFVDLLVKDYEK